MISESEIPDVDYDDLAPNTRAVEDENPFATMMSSFDEAADKLGLDPDVYAILRKPDREIQVSLPVHLDDGAIRFDGTTAVYEAAMLLDRPAMRGDGDYATIAGFVLDPLLAKIFASIGIPTAPAPRTDLLPLVQYQAPICPGCTAGTKACQ